MSTRRTLSIMLLACAALFSACSQDARATATAPSAPSGPQVLVSNDELVRSEASGPEAVVTSAKIAAGGQKVSPETVTNLVKKLTDAKTLNGALGVSSQLSDLGKNAYPLIAAELAASKGLAKVAILRSLYFTSRDNKELDAAVAGLTEIAGGRDERAVRLAAAELLEHLASPRHAKILANALDASFDTPVRVALAVALWNTAKEQKAINVLKDLLKSDSAESQKEAAIALGKTSHFDDAKDYLRVIANEPTLLGMIAKELIQSERLQRKLLSKITGSGGEEPINVDLTTLEHIIDMIGERYIYQEKVGRTRLKDKAAEGLLAGFDPYCAYLDEAEAKRAEAIKEFALPSLGLHFGATSFSFKRENREKEGFRVPTIISVDEGSTADDAGLLPGDQVINVAPGIGWTRVLQWRDGAAVGHEETVQDFLAMPLDNALETMRGTEGTSLSLQIRRDGWDLTRWVSLEHGAPAKVENLDSALDGGFRYARVTNFSADIGKFFETFLENAKAAEGREAAKGLIIDLRSCAAGSSAAAVAAAQLFLPANARVAHSFGRNEKIAPLSIVLADAKNRDAVTPLVVLVDGGTADAAEIFAAALQDNQRAKLIGNYTFGRALIQRVIPLNSKKAKQALLLTVGKYYTPVGGLPILDRGLEPDTKVELPLTENWVLDELDMLRKSKAISNYADKIIAAGDVALKIAHGDGGVIDSYPNFREFADATTAPDEIHLGDEDMRRAVRTAVRRKLLAAGKIAGSDLQEDHIFMVGLEAIAEATGVDLKAIDTYKDFVNAEKK